MQEPGIEGMAELLNLLTVAGLAKALKVAPSWVYARTRIKGADTIPMIRCGKYPRFHLPEVIDWLKRQQAQEAAQ